MSHLTIAGAQNSLIKNGVWVKGRAWRKVMKTSRRTRTQRFSCRYSNAPFTLAHRGTTSPTSDPGFPALRGEGARASAAPAFPLSCSVIGPRLWETANECTSGKRRGQYGFLHLVTVEETLLGLMEKPRGVEVRGRGLTVSGKGNPESFARKTLL